MRFLAIHLLGTPCVYWQEKPLHIPRRQARALLYRLAVHLRPIPREHLCYLFWSNESESRARRSLSHLLTHLRRALPEADDVLAVDDQIAVNPNLVWCDTVIFDSIYTMHDQQPPVDVLQELVNLYHGQFLEGFSLPYSAEFEAWMTLERCTWERHYLRVLDLMIDQYWYRESYSDAIDLAQRYLAINHLDEDMHRRLMQFYALTGDRGSALNQYRLCASALGRELGIVPLSETKALYLDIMNGNMEEAEARLIDPLGASAVSI